MQIELSIIIVNYNGLKYIKDCFNSLHKNLTNISYEIIVIDNKSTDKSCDYIIENYPEIVLIQSEENFGFGKGNNVAVKKAKGKYLLLINNDTIVLDNLSPIIKFFEKDEKLGVVGINMVDANKKYIPAFGNFPNIRNMFQFKEIFNTSQKLKKGFDKEIYEVDWLTGSFLFLTTRLYREINGFDEDYFMYVEDVDFCKRIADKGYKRIFLSQFKYIHFVGFNNSKNHLLIKGCEIYIVKHFKGLNKLICLLALRINKFVKTIKSVLKMD